jgi:hypothetical protein
MICNVILWSGELVRGLNTQGGMNNEFQTFSSTSRAV